MTPEPWITLGIRDPDPGWHCHRAFSNYQIQPHHNRIDGVALLVAARQVEFEKIPSYFDYDTLFLLFSMMVINANL